MFTRRRAQARVFESQKIIKACGGEKNQNIFNHCYKTIFKDVVAETQGVHLLSHPPAIS